MRRLLLSSAVALTLAAPLGAASQRTLTATLKEVPVVGQEGPGYKLVFLLTTNGKTVKSLPAGTYTLVVNDQSRVLNFHLTRANGADVRAIRPGGAARVTGVEKKEKVTFSVRLTRGTYAAFSDPHASFIRKTFRVG